MKQRSADAEELEHPRHDEQLQQKAEQADVAEIAAVGLADELLPRRRARRACAVHGLGRAHDVAAEQVFAGRVHDVQQQDERRDQQQIAIGEDHLEAARPCRELLVGLPGLRRSSRAPAEAVERSAPAPRTTTRLTAPPTSSRGGADALHELPGAHRPDPRAQAAADADQRKQPLALLLGEQVGGKRPELRDHHDVEDAEPQEDTRCRCAGPRRARAGRARG